MSPDEDPFQSTDPGTARFDTEWTRIRNLRTSDSEDAWRWFVRRYEALVRALLSRRLPQGLTTQASADFWAYLWQSRSVARADEARSFRRFLFGIVRRYALSWLRSNNRRLGDGTGLETIASPASESDEDLELWARDGMRVALHSLRQRFPHDAWAIERYYGVTLEGEIERQPVSAIARAMQKSISAVQQHLSRGRARLREFLANDLRRTVESSAEHQAEAALLFAQLRNRWPDLDD